MHNVNFSVVYLISDVKGSNLPRQNVKLVACGYFDYLAKHNVKTVRWRSIN